MILNAEIQVAPEKNGERLDVFVTGRFPSVPRSFVKKAVESAAILLNGAKAAKGAKVRSGDKILIIRLPEEADNRVKPDSSVPLDIVYDDGTLIGVDKPAGIAVQPLSLDETGTLMNALVAYAPELSEIGDDPLMAGALHRIDRGTSGLVLAARTNGLWTAMRDLFAARKVKKNYLALVEGHVATPGKVACELAHDPKWSVCRMVDARTVPGAPRPMYAETLYRPVHFAGNNTLLEVTIFTGVTHQIRAQLALAGFPICGDELYGAKTPLHGDGHRLHAYAVAFTHPLSGAPCRIATRPPKWAADFSAADISGPNFL